MEYLLKSILISSVLFAFYKAFLERDTFFQTNRVYFIVGLLLAVFLPLVFIPVYIEVEPVSFQTQLSSSVFTNFKTDILQPTEVVKPFDWFALLKTIYLIGVVVFSVKLVVELVALGFLIKNNPKKKEVDVVFVEVEKKDSPFSFFKWIVLNSSLFTRKELEQIINHEMIHVKQWHSVDMLLVQLLVIFQWFNPIVWLYKKALIQNLEYIADQSATVVEKNIKEYQYLLLKTGVAVSPFALPNNFFNSHLKKRIMMLQKSKSKRANHFKHMLLLPLLVVFMYAFNTKEIRIVKEVEISKQELLSVKPSFISPINIQNVKSISGYGMRVHPISHQKQMHNGIDYRAPQGADVLASADGIVLQAYKDKSYGKMVRLEHKEGYESLYAHLSDIQIEVGERVNAGEIIGNVGNTGLSTAPHLHFEILKDGKTINPTPLVIFEKANIEKDSLVQNSKSYSGRNFGITKATTDKQIAAIIADSKRYNKLDVSISEVKRNSKDEIIALKIFAKNATTQSEFQVDQTTAIADVMIAYDKPRNEIVIENFTMSEGTTTKKETSVSEHVELTFIQQSDNSKKTAINDNPIFTINSATTDAEIQEICNYFDTNFLHLKVENVLRNDDKKIYSYTISTHKEGDKKNERMMVGSKEPILPFTLQLNEDAKTITIFQTKKDCKSGEECHFILVIGEDTMIHRTKDKAPSKTKESGSVYYEGTTYYFTKRESKYEFYTKFGERLDTKLEHRIQKYLNTEKSITATSTQEKSIDIVEELNMVLQQSLYKSKLFVSRNRRVTRQDNNGNFFSFQVDDIKEIGYDFDGFHNVLLKLKPGKKARGFVTGKEVEAGLNVFSFKNKADCDKAIELFRTLQKSAFSSEEWKDNSNTGYLNYQDETYYYLVTDNKCDFFNRWGNRPSRKVSDVLLGELNKKYNKSFVLTSTAEIPKIEGISGDYEYQGKKYWFVLENGALSFTDDNSIPVNEKLAKKLEKSLISSQDKGFMTYKDKYYFHIKTNDNVDLFYDRFGTMISDKKILKKLKAKLK